MAVQGINDSVGPVVGQPARDTSQISKLDFMTLLVAQIQNQDPTSPMDNAQFTEQVTQFTMLDELSAMNEKLEENLMVGQSVNNTAMLALVGKNVTVEGNTSDVVDGKATENIINTQGPGTANVEVNDANGNVVATYQVQLTGGLNDTSWDGLDAEGNPLPDGSYSLDVTVTNSGIDVPFNVLKTGPVEGLRYENNVAVVMVGDQEYYVSEIYKVS
jgi:flagellar basal-body rod modification protein FlgD